MAVLLRNADITVYQLDPKSQTYTRININDVNWSSKRNSTVSDKGVNIAYTTMIVINNKGYKIGLGDKIIKGNVTIDITKISDLKDYEVLTVVGVQENSLFRTINIECK